MDKVMAQIKRFMEDEEGASAVEHGVLATFIVIVCAVAVSAMGVKFADAFGSPGDRL